MKMPGRQEKVKTPEQKRKEGKKEKEAQEPESQSRARGSAAALGRWGEEKTAEYLVKDGYLIRERRYRNRLGEIDLVAERDGILYFVEVKTRSSLRGGLPCEAVNPLKQASVRRAASCYLREKNRKNAEVRFAVAEVLVRGKKAWFRWMEEAF